MPISILVVGVIVVWRLGASTEASGSPSPPPPVPDPDDAALGADVLALRPWYRRPLVSALLLIQIAMMTIMSPQSPLIGSKSSRTGIRSSLAGAVLALTPFTSGCCSLTLGPCLAHLGLRRVLLGGVLLLIVSGTGFAAMDTVNGFAFVALAGALRAVGGLGQGAAVVAISTLWNTNFVNFSTLYGISEVATTTIGMVLPPLATIIQLRLGSPATFALIGASAAGLGTVAIRLLARSGPYRQPPIMGAGQFARALGQGPAAASALLIFASVATAGLLDVLIPYMSADLHIGRLPTSLLYSASDVFWMIGSLMAGALIDACALDPTRVLVACTMVTISGLLALVMGAALIDVVIVALNLLCISTACSMFVSYHLLHRHVVEVGGVALIPTVASLSATANLIGEAFGDSIGGLLYSMGAASLSGLSFAALTAIAHILYEIARRRPPTPDAAADDDDHDLPLLTSRRSLTFWQRLRSWS